MQLFSLLIRSTNQLAVECRCALHSARVQSCAELQAAHLQDAHDGPDALGGGQEGVRAECAGQLSAQRRSVHRACMPALVNKELFF